MGETQNKIKNECPLIEHNNVHQVFGTDAFLKVVNKQLFYTKIWKVIDLVNHWMRLVKLTVELFLCKGETWSHAYAEGESEWEKKENRERYHKNSMQWYSSLAFYSSF